MPTIALMHVGDQVELPTLMVRSFRRHNPDVRLVQVSDLDSPRIEGVGEVVRSPPRDGNMMLFRMRCFAALPTDDPTWFMDTDMLCVRPLEPPQSNTGTAVCLREFGRNSIFNHRFNAMDMSEYAGRTLGSIYPYVGCATYLHRSTFWRDCLREMEALDPKFHNWYGDQEAIRIVVESRVHRVSFLPESLYACLPEAAEAAARPYVFHYKGQRKPEMLRRAATEGLQ